jgi:DNA end-binding protein Ku
MPARAMWKGVIRFGRVAVPVKLYAAIENRKIHFRMLHREDLAPVRQKMVHSRTGEPVPPEMIRRGYELEDGRIVLLDDHDLTTVEPPESREIRISRFVNPSSVNHQWFDRPYYIGPDGDRPAYFSLVKALARSKKLGVAHWTMRKKSYFGALNVNTDGFMKMITLLRADEIVDVSGLQVPHSRELTRQELQMAAQLVGALEDDFDPRAFRDEYRERLSELLSAKARGMPVEFRKVERRAPEVVSLSELLKQSIVKAKEERKIAQAR